MLPLAALVTIIVIIAVTVGVIAYDIGVGFGNKVPNSIDTISGRMRIWSQKTLLLPWVWAALFGHFYAPKIHLASAKITIPILLGLTALVVIYSTLVKTAETTNSWLLFFLILNLGAIAGAVLWPQ